MLEGAFGKAQGIGDGSRQINVAVAIMADLLVDLLAQAEAGELVVLDEPSVIDFSLVSREGRLRQEHSSWREFLGVARNTEKTNC